MDNTYCRKSPPHNKSRRFVVLVDEEAREQYASCTISKLGLMTALFLNEQLMNKNGKRLAVATT